MYPSKTAVKASVLLIAALAVLLQAQVKTYPYISVTPATPVADRDSVKLTLALGQASNSCMAPTFKDLSFAITMSPIAIYPPQYSVTVSYTMVPVPPGTVCPMIYDPVDYGPSYVLGKLALGNYSVIDKNTGKTVGSFSVVNAARRIDSLFVKPAQPTTADSIRLTVKVPWDCCTRFVHDSTLVTVLGDTAVMVSFQHYLPEACPDMACFDNASVSLVFKRGPLPAGKYAVWESSQLTCLPPLICLTLPVITKIGEITVSKNTAVSYRQFPSSIRRNEITSEKLSFYDLKGVRISSGKTGTLSRTSGIVIVKDGRFLTKKASVR